jgi:hypothetical protein
MIPHATQTPHDDTVTCEAPCLALHNDHHPNAVQCSASRYAPPNMLMQHNIRPLPAVACLQAGVFGLSIMRLGQQQKSLIHSTAGSTTATTHGCKWTQSSHAAGAKGSTVGAHSGSQKGLASCIGWHSISYTPFLITPDTIILTMTPHPAKSAAAGCGVIETAPDVQHTPSTIRPVMTPARAPHPSQIWCVRDRGERERAPLCACQHAQTSWAQPVSQQ